ncbi:MAG: hypothetical protein ACYCX4_16640 [Bacillota bacterium]
MSIRQDTGTVLLSTIEVNHLKKVKAQQDYDPNTAFASITRKDIGTGGCVKSQLFKIRLPQQA